MRTANLYCVGASRCYTNSYKIKTVNIFINHKNIGRMKTAIKKKVVAKKNAKQPKKQKEVAAVIPEGVNENIDESLIEFSPFNRRRFYNQKALEELAADIKVHGVIHNITVRVKPDGRYELIIGNRRLGAARIAGLKSMPAKIVKIPDDLAKEIVFSENAHRENKQ